MPTKYKGFSFYKVYEILNEKGDCVNHGYSIKGCKMIVDNILDESDGKKNREEGKKVR